MSLLNDALRGVESRGRQTELPAAYPGGQAGFSRAPGSRLPLVTALVLSALALLVTAVAFWPAKGESVTEFPGPEQRSLVLDKSAPQVEVSEQAPEVATSAVVEPEVNARKEPVAVFRPVAEKNVTAAPRTINPDKSEPGKPEVGAVASAKEVKVETRALSEKKAQESVEKEIEVRERAKPPVAASETVTEVDEAALALPVKKQQETPEVLDRRTAEQMRKLLSANRLAEAEALISERMSSQAAPQSLARLARHLIVQGQPRRALIWLEADRVHSVPELRLLRARALLATGEVEQAVATLEADVPPLQQSTDYTVTLATLLQQQGRHNAAVSHWARLIAFDDSNGPWWAGLAIALEADQQQAGALRAYQQAVLMPGLSTALADYCRQRLAALRAG